MGLFGKLFKIGGKLLGGVAKSAASVVTHGASDKVLSILKGLGRSKAAGVPKRDQLSTQQLALINKVSEPLAPRVKQTTIFEQARAGNEQYGSYGRKRQAGKPSQARRAAAERARGGSPYDQEAAYKGLKRVKAPRTGGGRARALSPAMQVRANEMRRLAGIWRGLGGRDGTGQTFFEWKRGK